VNETIQRLAEVGALEIVPPDSPSAQVWLRDARRHLVGAAQIVEVDPIGSYVLCYDAARKAIAAIFLASGYRVTGARGSHAALGEAAVSLATNAREQGRLRGFDRMRRSRNRAEYGVRSFSAKELAAASDTAKWIVAFAEQRIG
jgi:hypothetical protein